MFIIVGGPSASGKTTLCRLLAQEVGAVHVSVEAVERAMVGAGLAKAAIGSAGYAVGQAQAEEHLRQGLTVLADSANALAVTREAWRAVGVRAAVPTIEVEVVCTDPEELRRRMKSRDRGEDEQARRRYEPWERDRLVVDTAGRTPGECLDRLRRGIDLLLPSVGEGAEAPLHGEAVVLRPPTPADIPRLARIRATPQVAAYWRGGPDFTAEVAGDFNAPGTRALVIEHAGRAVGQIQWTAEDDPDYRRAGIDVYLDPALHGRGLGADAVHALARHLTREEGFHRLTIDPAADNVAAIRAYAKAGFRPVGVMRRYERGADGTWHDGLLMDLLAEELPERPGDGNGDHRAAPPAG